MGRIIDDHRILFLGNNDSSPIRGRSDEGGLKTPKIQPLNIECTTPTGSSLKSRCFSQNRWQTFAEKHTVLLAIISAVFFGTHNYIISVEVKKRDDLSLMYPSFMGYWFCWLLYHGYQSVQSKLENGKYWTMEKSVFFH